VFKIIEALPGRSTERILARTRKTASGARLLAELPDLAARLSDRAALAALPAGTLGRAYFELTEKARISAQGIVAASMVERTTPLPDGELRWVGERMRDSHDLWHVVTGYGTDVIGEVALLAFTLAQARHLGIGMIVGFAYLQGVPGINEHIRTGYRRGKRAAWLPAVPWEQLLDQPLEAVRGALDLDAPPEYTPLSTAAVREGAFPVWRWARAGVRS